MIAEALKYITTLAQGAMRPEKVETGDPTTLTFIADGEPFEIEKPPPPRSHGADDLDSLVGLANRWADDNPVVWVDEDHVVLVIDDRDGHRVNTVTLELEKSEVFTRLEGLAVGKDWLDQKAFVRLLRIDLAGTLAPGILLDRVRKLRFESGQVTTQEATKNRESMGRQITAAVSADGDLPEAVTLEVRVFKGQERFSLVCSVDVDPARGLLQLVPLPDEIDRVIDLAVGDIQGNLDRNLEGVAVYNGRP